MCMHEKVIHFEVLCAKMCLPQTLTSSQTLAICGSCLFILSIYLHQEIRRQNCEVRHNAATAKLEEEEAKNKAQENQHRMAKLNRLNHFHTLEDQAQAKKDLRVAVTNQHVALYRSQIFPQRKPSWNWGQRVTEFRLTKDLSIAFPTSSLFCTACIYLCRENWNSDQCYMDETENDLRNVAAPCSFLLADIPIQKSVDY